MRRPTARSLTLDLLSSLRGSAVWGFRIDGRVLIGPANGRLVIDATPAVTTGAPADFIETATNPNIQFSNSPATGRQSTLSGPPLDGFTAFKATGVQTRVLITVGIFVRF